VTALQDVRPRQVITSARANLEKDYIEDGTERVKTKYVELSGPERKIEFDVDDMIIYDTTSNQYDFKIATNVIVSVTDINLDLSGMAIPVIKFKDHGIWWKNDYQLGFIVSNGNVMHIGSTSSRGNCYIALDEGSGNPELIFDTRGIVDNDALIRYNRVEKEFEFVAIKDDNNVISLAKFADGLLDLSGMTGDPILRIKSGQKLMMEGDLDFQNHSIRYSQGSHFFDGTFEIFNVLGNSGGLMQLYNGGLRLSGSNNQSLYFHPLQDAGIHYHKFAKDYYVSIPDIPGTGTIYLQKLSDGLLDLSGMTNGGTIGLGLTPGDPPSPVEGQLWYNSVLKQFRGFNGTTVVVLG